MENATLKIKLLIVTMMGEIVVIKPQSVTRNVTKLISLKVAEATMEEIVVLI